MNLRPDFAAALFFGGSLLVLGSLIPPAGVFADDGASDEVKLEYVLEFGGSGDEPGKFHSPIGIAIDAQDQIYVTEFHTDRVQKFTAEGRWLAAYPVAKQPGGIAVDAAGRLYVTPLLEHRLCVYDAEGRLLREWGRQGAADGEFDEPGGIAIAADGTVIVADQGNHRIQRFTPEGKFLDQWGGHGSAPGQFGGQGRKGARFSGPHFVALDAAGAIWTTEGAEGRIQKFSPMGKPLAAWGTNGTEAGGFGGREGAARNALPGPIGIAIDAQGRVWVSASNDRVQVFSAGGKYLGGLLERGSGPGQLSLPHGLAFDSKGFLYVVDSSNQRVQKFRL